MNMHYSFQLLYIFGMEFSCWKPGVWCMCKMPSGLLCAHSCHSRGLWPLQHHPSPGRYQRSSTASQATTEIIPRSSFEASSLWQRWKQIKLTATYIWGVTFKRALTHFIRNHPVQPSYGYAKEFCAPSPCGCQSTAAAELLNRSSSNAYVR